MKSTFILVLMVAMISCSDNGAIEPGTRSESRINTEELKGKRKSITAISNGNFTNNNSSTITNLTFSLTGGSISTFPISTVNNNSSTSYSFSTNTSGSQLTISYTLSGVSYNGSVGADTPIEGMWVDGGGHLWYVNDHGIVGLIF